MVERDEADEERQKHREENVRGAEDEVRDRGDKDDQIVAEALPGQSLFPAAGLPRPALFGLLDAEHLEAVVVFEREEEAEWRVRNEGKRKRKTSFEKTKK